MKIEKIRTKQAKIRKRLSELDKEYKRKRTDIVDEWTDLMGKCGHPNLQGLREGYCPDCGYTYG